MKLRFSFTFKILLPYLALAAIFFLIFLSEFQQGGTLVAWLAAVGLLLSFLFGIFKVHAAVLLRIFSNLFDYSYGSF